MPPLQGASGRMPWLNKIEKHCNIVCLLSYSLLDEREIGLTSAAPDECAVISLLSG